MPVSDAPASGPCIALHGARFLTDWHSPIPLQRAMAEFIVGGHFARHVRRLRLVYEARQGGGSVFRIVFADPARWEQT